MRKGVLKSFVSGTYIATVQIIGSLALWEDVPTSRGIASVEMVAGRKVVIAQLDPANPNDQVIVGVYT